MAPLSHRTGPLAYPTTTSRSHPPSRPSGVALALGSTLLAFLLPALALLGGCGLSSEQAAAVITFSQATREVSAAAADQITSTRADVIELRRRRFAIESTLRTPGETEATPALDAGVEADQAAIRLRALTALGQYAELLQSLATEQPPAAIGAAADKLTRTIATLSKSVSTERATILGSAASTLASKIVLAQRQEAARQVALSMEKPINSLIDLLKADFDASQFRWVAALDTERTEARRVARSIGSMAPPTPPATREAGATYLDPAKFAVAQQASAELLSLAQARADASQASRAKLLTSLGAMREAHDTLLIKLQSSSIRTGEAIERFLDAAQDLISTAELYKKAG